MYHYNVVSSVRVRPAAEGKVRLQREVDAKDVLRRQTKGSKIEGKMGTKWHGFMATDTIQNPALMPKYTTILHVAKAGRGLRVYAERLESPTEAGYAHLSVEMCPKGYPLMGQNYTL